jgi:hypothetical protein
VNEHNDEILRFDRRRVFQLFGALTGFLVLFAPKARAQAALNCKSKVALDPTATQTRRNVQYVEKSNLPGKKCSTCAQFEAGKYKECGGCKLFGGAVNPEGVCLSWAAKKA